MSLIGLQRCGIHGLTKIRMSTNIITIERKFDWRPRFDSRSLNFLAVTEEDREKPFRNYTFHCPYRLNQGTEGACVGHGVVHAIGSRPRSKVVTQEMAFWVYEEAKKIDYWEGEAYSGTSVLAGLQVAKREGLIKEYRWHKSLDDVLRSNGRGPVVFGMNWYTGMMNPVNGWIHKTGIVEGGHCVTSQGPRVMYFVKGDKISIENVDKKKGYVTILNSWGTDWGVNGTARMNLEDLEALLYESGECAIITK